MVSTLFFATTHLNHREICRHTATFCSEQLTAWILALRIKGNAYETKIPKPPRINLRCATENYPQRISNTGSKCNIEVAALRQKGRFWAVLNVDFR